jgi:hypothetical protein
MCNNAAPDNPRYYKRRYQMKHRLDTIATDLEHIKAIFPKLVCKMKKLSLTNYKGSGNGVSHQLPLETDIEIDKEREEESELALSPLAMLWNETCKSLPKVISESKSRMAKVRLALKRRTLEEWREVFNLMEQSPFIRGENKQGWVGNYDWIIKNEDNSTKVLEGNYNSEQAMSKANELLKNL